MKTWETIAESHCKLHIAGRFPLDDRDFSVRYHSTITALHMHEYSGEMRFGKWTVALQPGDITISPAREDTFYSLPQPGYHLCLHFTPETVKGSPVRLSKHITPGHQLLHYRRKIEEIIALFRMDDISSLRAELLLQEMLLDLSCNQTPSANTTNDVIDNLLNEKTAKSLTDKISHAASLLRDRFCKNWSIPALARQVELSPNYFTRQFHAQYGVSPQKYLTRCRLEYSMFMLTSSSLTIKQIGVRCGISDPQFFNKLFRRHTGLSPSAFRNRKR